MSVASQQNFINEGKIANKPFDILTISETNLDSTITDSEVSIQSFCLERLDRNRRGGGVAVYIDEKMSYHRRLVLDSNVEVR